MPVSSDALIHHTAIVEAGAQIGAGCRIGPYSIVGPEVVLADRVEIRSHVVVSGRTEIGEDSVVFPFASIGEIPQDKKFQGERTRLVIGARARIREHVTINAGTDGGGGITSIGDDGLFLAGCHIAHDCRIGNNVTIVNHAAIAGHCVIEDDVIIGGLVGVHQFVRIGRGAFIGAVAMVTNDVIPYGMVHAARGELEGLNLVGLKRKGMKREDIHRLRAAYQELAQGEGSFQERAERLRDSAANAQSREIAEFILAGSDRSFLTPR